MTPRVTSLLVVAAAFTALLLLAPDVLLIVLAGVLIAVFLRGGGRWIGEKTGIPGVWGVALFLLALIAAAAAFGIAVAPAVVEQVDALVRRLPESFDALREDVASYAWGPDLLKHLTPGSLASWSAGSVAATAVTSTFGALGNAVLVFFIGLYGALDPQVYKRGVTLLFAPTLRPQAEEVLEEVAVTLGNWLAARLIAMAVVGALTAAGLWAAGIPLAFALGLIAGLLTFIPNIGPVISIVPALLLAWPGGQTDILIVVSIYLGVQTLESYAITPLIQQEKVDLPPAFIIACQLLLGTLFGLLGLALATPIAAAVVTITNSVYVARYLEREKDDRAENRDTADERW